MSKHYRKHQIEHYPWAGVKQSNTHRREIHTCNPLCKTTSDLSLLCDKCLIRAIGNMEREYRQ